MSLAPGTYLITCFCYIDIIDGSTTVKGMSSTYSTSATEYSHSVDARMDGGAFIYPIGSAWSLNLIDFIVVTSTTTYYMIVRCIFGTVARLRFITTFSKFSAVRIA